MRSALPLLVLALLATGCSVIGAGVAVTSAAVSVGAAVVSTTVTVGAAAVRGVVKVGETVVDAATAPPSEDLAPTPGGYDAGAHPAQAEARPVDIQAPIDQRELPNRLPSIDKPCCTN